MFGFIYTEILYRPILNLLIYVYNIIPGHDIGIAIIILTIIIKAVLWPLSKKSIKAQREMQELQPLMDEIKKKYKDKKEEMAKELMALYKTHKVNPMGSCLPLLIQFPFLIAVYRVFYDGFKPETLQKLYPFVAHPGTVNPMFLNLIDMSKPVVLLALLVGLAQFWQTKMLIHTPQPKVDGSKDESMMANMNKQMMYFMPIITVIIGFKLPSGLILYWLLTTLLTILQQYIFFKTQHKPIVAISNNIIEGEKIEEAKQIDK
ncbi:MAG: YidC/Oxa1 family membrane protein insertase [bacterium]